MAAAVGRPCWPPPSTGRSAVLQLERIYQNETDLLRHKLQASKADAEAHNAEANWLAQQCRVLRLQILSLGE